MKLFGCKGKNKNGPEANRGWHVMMYNLTADRAETVHNDPCCELLTSIPAVHPEIIFSGGPVGDAAFGRQGDAGAVCEVAGVR